MIICKYFKKDCAPCRQLDPILTKVCEEKGINLQSIDVEMLTKEQIVSLGLRSVPTTHFMGDDLRTVVKLGTMTELELRKIIDSFT